MSIVQPDPRPRRRGRVAMGPAVRTGPVGEFACRLFELKKTAGDPSYDRMRSEFGALASKSALSAAARGYRLPTWETTWEFVRSLEVGVLGGDVESVRLRWREYWEDALAMCDESAGLIDVPAPAAIEVSKPAAVRLFQVPRWVPRWVGFAVAGLIAAVVLVVGLAQFR